MKEAVGDFWKYPAEYRLVTTNGIVRKNGLLVMGKGVALGAALRYPHLPQTLGHHVRANGNVPCLCPDGIISFPTKHHWRDDSLLDLIDQSAAEVVRLVNTRNIKSVASPRPGCGNGNLRWSEVKAVLRKYFDDRFTIVTLEPA